MLVSWDWLKEYVNLPLTPDQLAQRLSMSGLNHEGATQVDGDTVLDLEVTSNRPDCLGHIGVAREIGVLCQEELCRPNPQPRESSSPVGELVRVRIDCPELCPRYTARVIRGVKIKESPAWLAKRLAAVNVASVNNIVDITNYVLMECGQPLHTFDLAKLSGREIIVREAEQGEEFEAINHQKYVLEPGMCVITDAERSVAIGGVMGGADSEISANTTDVLIETADFDQLSVRNTARRLNLGSDSSYRFERGVDPEGIDWASRRCCEMILDLAGGELASGVVDVVGRARPERAKIVFRFAQVARVLGIEVDPDEACRILASLGLTELSRNKETIELRAPSWRRDLSREIDLIEEVARIHGYEQIPEDKQVAMTVSHRPDADRVMAKVRTVLTAAGFDEAVTASVVNQDWSDAFSPWTREESLKSLLPMLRGAEYLRRSLVPSLLGVRRLNESLSNDVIELFETAKVYLPRPGQMPAEPLMLGITSGQDFFYVKGIIEKLLNVVDPQLELDCSDFHDPLFASGKACRLGVAKRELGVLGTLSAEGCLQFDLRGPTTVAELRIEPFCELANLIPQYTPHSAHPAIVRDLNLIVSESLRWAELSATVRSASDKALESIDYRETYRDPERDGVGKKRLLFSMTFRKPQRTLTGDEADAICQAIVAECRAKHAAELLT